MKAALIQLTSSDIPADNARMICDMLGRAADQGAGFALTPEVSNCVSLSRGHQAQVLHPEASDPTLAAIRDAAHRLGLWVSIGSLAVKTGDADGRYANRSFIIDPAGDIRARYDKIHMFDIALPNGETYAESRGYRPGTQAVTCATPFGVLGLSICYDLRFPDLYRRLAQAGAQILLVPAAFTVPTGRAHWEPLLRARAIECGAYVLASAQTGHHPTSTGRSRDTYGHSLAVSPWGEILADAGTGSGISLVDLDMGLVNTARADMPSLSHDQSFTGPNEH